MQKGFFKVEDAQLKALIESLIFVSESPLSLERIKEVLREQDKKDLRRLLSELVEEYGCAQRGFTLVEVAGGFQFRTRPDHAEWIKRLKKTKPLSLTQPALETLAIIAYQQPVVRADVERIRGVDSGGVLRTLLERKLIKILGKKDVPGRPLVYGTSRQFLEVFGLKNLSSLPTLKDIEGLAPPSLAELEPGQEPGQEKEGASDELPSKSEVAEDSL